MCCIFELSHSINSKWQLLDCATTAFSILECIRIRPGKFIDLCRYCGYNLIFRITSYKKDLMDYDIANVNNIPVGLRKMCMVICRFAELYRTRPM